MFKFEDRCVDLTAQPAEEAITTYWHNVMAIIVIILIGLSP